LFKALNTRGATLVEIVKPLLAKFELTSKVICLATLNSSLLNIVFCGVFQLEKPYLGVCFGHVMSKVCQYVTNEDVVYQCMKEAQSAPSKNHHMDGKNRANGGKCGKLHVVKLFYLHEN
jgi:hypothetical protein